MIFLDAYSYISESCFGSSNGIGNVKLLGIPEYSDVIDIKSLRRMSEMVKMGMYNSLICLKNVPKKEINGIVAASGLGCIDDTYRFWANIETREPHHLNPTSFIHSTHNTLAGMLGIFLENHHYNVTWTNGFNSFINALYDIKIKMQLTNNKENYISTSSDEMPVTIQEIIKQIPFNQNKTWTFGSASFIFSNKRSEASIASIEIEKIDWIFEDQFSALFEQEMCYISNAYINSKMGNFNKQNIKNLESKTGFYYTKDALALCLAIEDISTNQFRKILFVGGEGKSVYGLKLMKLQ